MTKENTKKASAGSVALQQAWSSIELDMTGFTEALNKPHIRAKLAGAAKIVKKSNSASLIDKNKK